MLVAEVVTDELGQALEVEHEVSIEHVHVLPTDKLHAFRSGGNGLSSRSGQSFRLVGSNAAILKGRPGGIVLAKVDVDGVDNGLALDGELDLRILALGESPAVVIDEGHSGILVVRGVGAVLIADLADKIAGVNGNVAVVLPEVIQRNVSDVIAFLVEAGESPVVLRPKRDAIDIDVYQLIDFLSSGRVGLAGDFERQSRGIGAPALAAGPGHLDGLRILLAFNEPVQAVFAGVFGQELGSVHCNSAAVGAVLVGGYWADAAVLEHIKGERVVSVCVAYVVNAVENNFNAREVSIGDRIRRGLFEMRGVGVNLTGLGELQDITGEAGGLGKELLARPVHESVAFFGRGDAGEVYRERAGDIAVLINLDVVSLKLGGLNGAHGLVGGDVLDKHLLVVGLAVWIAAVIAAAELIISPDGVESDAILLG